MNLRHAILMLAAIISLQACKKDNTTVTPNNPAADTVTYRAMEMKDVSYGAHPYQKMDVYFPDRYSSQTPVVFVIHGGGFIAGLKEDFTEQALIFRSKGYIVANLSHRLVDTTGLLSTPPVRMNSDIKIGDELNDVHSAVTKYMAMAPEWHSGTGKMYMAGHSAGAILSLLYTLGDKNNDKHIRACGNWAGLTDMTIPNDTMLANADPRLLEAYWRISGFEPKQSNNLAYMAISAYWVAYNNGGMPTISIYPENNTVLNLPDENAYNLHRHEQYHELLRSKGVAEKLSIYSGNDHGFGVPGSWDKLITETAAFFSDK